MINHEKGMLIRMLPFQLPILSFGSQIYDLIKNVFFVAYHQIRYVHILLILVITALVYLKKQFLCIFRQLCLEIIRIS